MKSHIQNPRLRWLKENLFKTPVDIFLTLATLALSCWIMQIFLKFTFYEADWTIVTDNVHLLTVGSYPAEEVWRVLLNSMFALLLLGATVGYQTRMGKKSWLVLSCFAVLGMAMIWIYPLDQKGLNQANAYFICVAIVMYLAGYFLQIRLHLNLKVLVIAWSIYFILGFVVLAGFEQSTLFPAVPTNKWGGFLLTVLVTLVGIGCSLPLGIALALGRRSSLPVVKYFCIALIEFVRGVPMITILFMGQALIPLFLPPSLEISNLMRIMIAVTLFAAAYMAEYVRGGLQAIPKGQVEAAQALGLNTFQITSFIVLPQALRAVIPGLVGECITLFKDTSLVTIVGLLDLTGAARAASSQPLFIGRDVEMFLTIAIIYWVFSFLMSRYSQNIEKRLGVGTR